MNKKMKLLGIMAFALILTGCSSRSVDMKSAVDVMLIGGDGNGSMYIEVNNEYLIEELGIDVSDYESVIPYLELLDTVEVIYDDEYNKLSNGDSVKVEIQYDQTLAKKLKVKFDNTKFSIIVKDLQETVVVSFVGKLRLLASGEGPEYYVNLEYLGDDNLNERTEISILGDEGQPVYKIGEKLTVEVRENTIKVYDDNITIKEELIELTVEQNN